MNYLSVCSGIEAATVAWHPLRWQPVAFSEIDAFPSALLAHYYPHVPNRGDMTRFKDWPDADVDLLVGGTPCQSFSVAGLRKGLDDPRGSLMLTYLAIARRYRPRWLVWENVHGVLSADDGRAFGSLLGGMAELGYGFAYRVLDAQYFGLAQRRRRVFVVGHLGDWRRAAAVLFERESLSGHPAPRREAGEGVAPTIGGCSNGGGANGPGRDVDSCESLIPSLANPLGAKATGGWRGDLDHDTYVGTIAFSAKDHGADAGELAPTLRAGGFTTSHANGGVMPAVAFDARQSDVIQYGEKSGPLDTDGHSIAVAFDTYNQTVTGDTAQTLCSRGDTSGGNAHLVPAIQTSMRVRRLTPRECERLQGFPDDYTLIPYRGKLAADGPRYKALGNSMAVPVMAWIGRRIALVEDIG